MKRIIFGLIVLTFFTSNAFAEELIFVTTDSSSYKEGDVIVVSGNVTTVIADTPVTMQLFSESSLIDVGQITVAQDGTFSSTLIPGPLWTNAGEYIIRVLYGEGNIAETVFSFFPKTNEPVKTEIFEVDAGSYGTFDVEYKITGGIVKDMKIDPNSYSLIVTIEAIEKGSILLEIPRYALDAKTQEESDEEFIVLIDDIPVKYEENEKNQETRIMTINFEKDDKIITIIGTTIIPEFGGVAIMVLIAGFVVIIITKNKSSSMLKFLQK